MRVPMRKRCTLTFPTSMSWVPKRPLDSLRSAIAARETDTMTFWRAWVEQETQSMLGEDTVLSFKKLIDMRSEPRFATLLQAIAHKYIEILTLNLATDFSMDPKVDRFPNTGCAYVMGSQRTQYTGLAGSGRELRPGGWRGMRGR